MKNYQKSKTIHPCHLTKKDVFELVEKIKSDFPTSDRKEDFQVSITSKDFNISENDIQKVFGHNDLPKVLTRISFRMLGWSENRDIDKSIYLSFYNSFIELNVSGFSESWVNGKYLQISNFLKTKKPIFWFLKPRPVLGMLLGIGLFWAILLLASVMIEIFLDEQTISLGLSSIVAFLVIVAILVLKFRYTKIYLTEKRNFWETGWFQFVVLLAGIAAIIGTIFALVLYFSSNTLK